MSDVSNVSCGSIPSHAGIDDTKVSCSEPEGISNNPQLSVLLLGDTVDYVIPSFSVLQVNLLPAKVTFENESDQYDVFLNSDGDIPSKLPFSLLIAKQCTIDVSTTSWFLFIVVMCA